MLYVKVFEFMRHIETEYKALMDDLGLDLAEIHILRALYAEDKVKAGKLAHKVGRSPYSFTDILDRLEDKGFICREKHATDRRAILICLTRFGESHRKNIVDFSEEADEQLEAELGVYLPVEWIEEHAPGVGQWIEVPGDSIAASETNESLPFEVDDSVRLRSSRFDQV